jgi:hypothetical protein
VDEPDAAGISVVQGSQDLDPRIRGQLGVGTLLAAKDSENRHARQIPESLSRHERLSAPWEVAAYERRGKECRMRKARISTYPILIALALAPLACSTTTFDSTWRAPEAQPLRLQGQKVVGVFLSKSPVIRRKAEDAMAQEISARGAQGVPAYTVLSDEEVKDQEAAKAKLESLGFGGAVVMRVVGKETQYSYEPGVVWARPYYRHFWGGYWRWGWGVVYEPGYLSVDKVVKVETLVYSLVQDQLVWAGVSRTVDPSHIDDFIAELAKAVSEQLEKEGLLKRS